MRLFLNMAVAEVVVAEAEEEVVMVAVAERVVAAEQAVQGARAGARVAPAEPAVAPRAVVPVVEGPEGAELELTTPGSTEFLRLSPESLSPIFPRALPTTSRFSINLPTEPADLSS